MTMLVSGILEYTTSWVMETLTGLKWWDYSGYVLNLNGRICLEGLLFFAVGGLVIVYYFAPLVNYLLDKIPFKMRLVILGVLLSAFTADAIYSHFVPNVGEGITN